jgi:hypothetical protein
MIMMNIYVMLFTSTIFNVILKYLSDLNGAIVVFHICYMYVFV